MSQKSDKPAYFAVGTAVSAKYRGAYCSAVVKKVSRVVKVKVHFDKQELGTLVLSEEAINGDLILGNKVEATHPVDGLVYKGTVAQITDQSVYTVVYDDGDMSNLKRSALCIPAGRHFRETESLDAFPLINPDDFGNPVKKELIARPPEETNNDDGTIDDHTPSTDSVGNAMESEEHEVPNNVVVPETAPTKAPTLPGSSKSLKNVRKTKRLKRKPKKPKAKSVLKKKEDPKPATSTTEMVVEPPRDVKPPEVPGTSAAAKYTYYYVTPPTSLQVTVPKMSCSQKRKAFIPKKVIKVIKQVTRGKENMKVETTPGPINTASFDLDSSSPDSKNQTTQPVEFDLEFLKREPDTSPSSSPSSGQSEAYCDYTHKKLNFKRFSSGSKNDGTNDEASTLSSTNSSTNENSSSIGSLYTELSTICKDKKIKMPISPPTGKNYNFVPNLECLKDTRLRQKLITESLKAIVIQYFATKELLERHNKHKKKDQQD